jgi:hypothetical protein
VADRRDVGLGLAAVALPLLCCGAPVLISAIGVFSVSTLLAWGTRIVLPAAGLAFVAAALVLYSRFRRTHVPSACCDDRADTPARTL